MNITSHTLKDFDIPSFVSSSEATLRLFDTGFQALLISAISDCLAAVRESALFTNERSRFNSQSQLSKPQAIFQAGLFGLKSSFSSQHLIHPRYHIIRPIVLSG